MTSLLIVLVSCLALISCKGRAHRVVVKHDAQEETHISCVVLQTTVLMSEKEISEDIEEEKSAAGLQTRHQ